MADTSSLSAKRGMYVRLAVTVALQAAALGTYRRRRARPEIAGDGGLSSPDDAGAPQPERSRRRQARLPDEIGGLLRAATAGAATMRRTG